MLKGSTCIIWQSLNLLNEFAYDRFLCRVIRMPMHAYSTGSLALVVGGIMIALGITLVISSVGKKEQKQTPRTTMEILLM